MTGWKKFLQAYYTMFFWAMRMVACLIATANLVMLIFVVIDLSNQGGRYGFAGLAFVVISLAIAFVMWKVGSVGLLRLRRAKAE